MNLWWLVTSSAHCSYSELKRRRCVALGWSEIGSLSRYIKDKPGWERQFKTFVQVRGNLAYSRDRRWTEELSALTGVPSVFWNLLQIRQDDYVVVMETGSQLTLGNIEVQGFARVSSDAIANYRYDDQFHHAHQVFNNLEWRDWDRAHHGELQRPQTSFTSLLRDNDQLEAVRHAWEDAHTAKH